MTVIRNANMITLEPAQPCAAALAVRDGIIVAVGDEAAVAPYLTSSRVIDAGGGTVVPA